MQGQHAFRSALPVEFARVVQCTACDRCADSRLLRDDYENVPQPGYVGRDYESTRVLLVGQNPATPKSRSQLDSAYTAALRALRDNPCESTFGALSDTLRDYVPQWPVHQSYFPLTECGLTLDQIAYFNLVRCRTIGDAPPRATLSTSCISQHFDQWIRLLQPRVVVFIGKWAAVRAHTILDAHKIPYGIVNRKRNLSGATRAEDRAAVAGLVRRLIRTNGPGEMFTAFNVQPLTVLPKSKSCLSGLRYRIKRDPARRLVDHNEVSWKLIKSAFSADMSGTVSGDTLCALVRNHVHGDKSKHGPQPFIDYCVTRGWLEVA